jgi:hypothetical protein
LEANMRGQEANHHPGGDLANSDAFSRRAWALLSNPLRADSSTHLPLRSYRSAFSFETRVDDDLRTCGVVVDRPGRCAIDLDGLNFNLLTAAAAGTPEAAARGKVVLVGGDGVAVFQTKPGANPELAWCGNGSATVALVLGRRRAAFDVFGPDGKVVRVDQTLVGASVRQAWTLSDFSIAEANWLGRPAIRCSGLNTYAVVVGPLPTGVTPDEARRALAGPGLTAKLMVVTPSATGVPHVAFHNAHGLHGAAPTTGVATLAILARRSRLVGGVISGGAVIYDSKAGTVEAPLPNILIEPAGAISVVMPSVDVKLSPLIERDWQ